MFVFSPLTVRCEKCLVAKTAPAALDLVEQLPDANKNILRFVIHLLREVSGPGAVEHTKMGGDNLAMVFAPCLLRFNTIV